MQDRGRIVGVQTRPPDLGERCALLYGRVMPVFTNPRSTPNFSKAPKNEPTETGAPKSEPLESGTNALRVYKSLGTPT